MGVGMEGEQMVEAGRLGSVFEKGRFRHGKAEEMLDGRIPRVDDTGGTAYGDWKNRSSGSVSTLVLGTCNALDLMPELFQSSSLTVIRSTSAASSCSEVGRSAPSSSSSTMT